MKIYSISLYVLMASRENIKMTVALAVLPLEAGEVLNAALCLGSTDCVQLMCFKRINFSFLTDKMNVEKETIFLRFIFLHSFSCPLKSVKYSVIPVDVLKIFSLLSQKVCLNI